MVVDLRHGLNALIPWEGRTETDFVATLGPPTSESLVGAQKVLQWQRGTFSRSHLAVAFQDGRFVAVTHRYRC